MIKDLIKQALEQDMCDRDIVDELYQDEHNWNNADKTSGQCVYTEAELFSMIEKVRGEDK